MSIRTGILILFLLLIALIAGGGCATDKKAREIIKKADSSCDLAHLGKNKYYYSPHYKKRLASNIKMINRRK